ncbi:MAG: MarR family transcriptional regulator, partial [Clostridiales bacterium]|nr:MarR family transcriptional regulator [Clostridiales bacterium]
MTVDKEKIIKSENEFYLGKIFAMLKKMEKIAIANKSAKLGDTELRLISEIVFSNYKGERLISTQLAKKLDVTRSAVSQIVKKLEKDGVIKRVPDEIDKKIAYIELTEN